MFPAMKKLRQNWRHFTHHDAEAEALEQAVDRYEIEAIHRRFARQGRSGSGY